MDNLEIDNENERAYETKFCAILLESARRYSTLADIVFNVSVQQSNFASTISGQRMTLAKLAIQKQTDFTVILEGNELETYQTTEQTDNVIEMWEDCLSFDEVIQKILQTSDAAKWEPVILGLQSAIEKGDVFLKNIISGRDNADVWQCQNCGAATFTTGQPEICSICDSQTNWMVPVELNETDEA